MPSAIRRCLILLLALGSAAAAQETTPLRVVPIAEAPFVFAGKQQCSVMGVVTCVLAPEFFFLQDGSGALRVNIRGNTTAKAGDYLKVNLESYDARQGHGGWFISNSSETHDTRPLPVPRAVRADEINVRAHDSLLLRVRGKVVGHTVAKATFWVAGKWQPFEFDTLFTDCDGLPVRVAFVHRADIKRLFPVGTVAEFDGVSRVTVTRDVVENRQIEIVADSPASVRIINAVVPAASALPRGVIWSLWSLAAVAFGGSGLFFLRSRRARIAAENLRQANSELEERVAARTAELQASNESLRESQRNLAEALERQTELVTLKTNFVSLVSHEFRTPLEIITSSAYNLDRYHERLSETKRHQLLATINRAVQRMAGMMEQVLFLGRLEPGRVQFKPLPLDIPWLARVICEEIESSTAARCPVTIEISGDVTGAVGDEAVLRHIFTNLLSNAVKYSPDGSSVLFKISRHGTGLTCSISDRGRGIPPADQAQLFEAFHRGGNVQDTAGTGLGLVIVRRCIEVHGGAIEFESQPGKGTTFTVHLPLFAAA